MPYGYILVLLTICQSELTPICFIGDNLYGDFSPFLDQFDPRPVMGTYNPIDVTNQQTTSLSVDFTSQMYQHKNYNEDSSNYIFKITNVGWVISKEAFFNTATETDIVATCFEDNISDCTINSWFNGYNNVQHSLCSVKIIEAQCPTDMCMDNFNVTITTNNGQYVNTYELNGILKAASPTEPCTMDSSVCESNRTYWINQNDNSYRWYYRLTKNANWVYGRSGSDRIACAPGHVENPLFCNTFVYAGDTTDYQFKSGECNSSITESCPTSNPTEYPSAKPTVTFVSRHPSISPSINPTVTIISFPSVNPTSVPIENIFGNNAYYIRKGICISIILVLYMCLCMI